MAPACLRRYRCEHWPVCMCLPMRNLRCTSAKDMAVRRKWSHNAIFEAITTGRGPETFFQRVEIVLSGMEEKFEFSSRRCQPERQRERETERERERERETHTHTNTQTHTHTNTYTHKHTQPHTNTQTLTNTTTHSHKHTKHTKHKNTYKKHTRTHTQKKRRTNT